MSLLDIDIRYSTTFEPEPRAAAPTFAAPGAARDRATRSAPLALAQANASTGASGAAPSIFTPRAPRFVDYTPCPMCGYRLGLEYQGELRSGVKLHTIAAHSAGRGSVRPGEPRCLGAGLRMVFTPSGWRGEVRP